MTGFCRSEGCRHALLADYFGEATDPCETRCDNCAAGPRERTDITEEARMFLSALYRTDQRFGKGHLIDVLRGSENRKIRQFGHDRLSVYGVGAKFSKSRWEAVAERLMELGALRRGEHRNLVMTPLGAEILKGNEPVWIRSDRLQAAPKRPERKRPEAEFSYDKALFDRLRELRRSIAAKEGVPAYMVFGDRTLMEMAARRPSSKEEMLAVGGVGEKKFQRYGEAFLKRIEEDEDGGM